MTVSFYPTNSDMMLPYSFFFMADSYWNVSDSFRKRTDASKKHDSDTYQYESASTKNESATIQPKNFVWFIYCTGGFILICVWFMFFGWIRPFAKWIHPFFNTIRHFSHESATFFRKKSRLPLLDISKQKCPFSALFIFVHGVFMHFSCLRHIPYWIRHGNIWSSHFL